MKKVGLFIMFMVLFIFIAGYAYAGDKGNVAVAAEGKTAAADVSVVAARCPYFLIYDYEGNFLGAMDNPYKTAGRKAGPSVVLFLTQKGVTFVVAGQFGEKMIQAMEGKGIQFLEFHGSAEAALEKVQELRRKN